MCPFSCFYAKDKKQKSTDHLEVASIQQTEREDWCLKEVAWMTFNNDLFKTYLRQKKSLSGFGSCIAHKHAEFDEKTQPIHPNKQINTQK